MDILVIGGTGKVGRHLVSALVERGAKVRVLGRSEKRLSALPAGAEGWTGDIFNDPAGAAPAFAGIGKVFMLNQPSVQETIEGMTAVLLARDAGVRHFVYQSVHPIEEAPHIPHLGAKIAIESAVAASGMDHTFIRPNHFFQNDESRWCLDKLAGDNCFIQPLGAIGCARIDARDIADAAAAVLTGSGHESQAYALAGPDNLTGADCAAIWSEALGRLIRANDDCDAYLAGEDRMPNWLRFDVAAMYGHFARHGALATAEDLDRLTILLGRPPRSYRDYVTELAPSIS